MQAATLLLSNLWGQERRQTRPVSLGALEEGYLFLRPGHCREAQIWRFIGEGVPAEQ